ncbi:MAG TPA: hypothetical protein VD971_11780 [Phycisphaerales bacterium]|nr:hypothetical protein [Phycisphaerales bacterium]
MNADAATSRAPKAVRWLAALHAAYYAVTGVWPIVHVGSFLAVTGPKTDLWLVQLFGALVCVPALVMGHAAATGRMPAATFITAVASTVTLGAGDVIFVAKGSIGPVYLLDAGVEFTFLAAWSFLAWRSRGAAGSGRGGAAF